MTVPTSPPLPCLHIGMSKTATALVQHEAFPVHSGLCFFGKCVPKDNMWITRENARFVEQVSGYVEPEALNRMLK